MNTPAFKRLIIASYRLPFTVLTSEEGVEIRQNSGGLVSAILSMAEQLGQTSGAPFPKIHWVGHSDNPPDDLPASALENEAFVVHPVYLDPALNEAFYEGFCNNLVWPLFHYFPSYASFQEHYFKAYQQANARFLETLRGVVEPGDLVWIHDYQLMLLPCQIREAFPGVAIGYFFHIPFPSYEIFKLLPRAWRQELLEGILGADVVGFHTDDYARHFLQSVEEVLGLPLLDRNVVLADRSVLVDAFPISVDFQKFDATSRTRGVVAQRKNFKRLLHKNAIIFSVDRLDYSKGILKRLLGFERFLVQHPDWHNQVTFVMTVVPSRDKIGQYQELKREIEETVGRINGQFGTIGWRPIVYSYLSLSFEDLLALYTACDVALITPLRDGMNLVAKEFVASRYDHQGVLILSELAGAAQELTEALIINPVDTQEVANAIGQGLTMNRAEQSLRMRRMRNQVRTNDVFHWTQRFLAAFGSPPTPTRSEVSPALSEPVWSKIAADFQTSPKRLLLFDYDGTLTPLVDTPSQAVLAAKVRESLGRLAATTELVVISGRDRAFLDAMFEGIALHLVAEHGAFLRHPGHGWQRLTPPVADWADALYPVLREYAGRFDRSFIEEKETALAWHYRLAPTADQGAAELASRLRKIPSAVPLVVIEGNKVVEVKPALHTKGTAARHFCAQEAYDFVLALGDDVTDEDIFGQVPPWAYTVKVGPGATLARYRLAAQPDVERLLHKLAALRG